MDRRGQGISINVIVIAAIALLILVILSVLAIRSGTTIGKGIACDNLGGVCTPASDFGPIKKCDTDNGYVPDNGGTCAKTPSGDSAYCCRKI